MVCRLLAGSLLLAALPRRCTAQDFVTALSGLGGTPIGASPIGAVGTSTLDLYSLSDVDAEAVCNGLYGRQTCAVLTPTAPDGSAAGYYFAPGSGDGSQQWLVYLEGSACPSVALCSGETARGW